MKVRIENVLRVRPEIFWTRLFFAPDYNEGLYRALRFESYEVIALERHEDGRIRRVLRAEPPLSGPPLVRRALKGRLAYAEEGVYDPTRGIWEFVNRADVPLGSTQVAGAIRVHPHARGLAHVVDLEVSVSALGLGALIERAIESSTRESYRMTAAYTDEYAARHGLLA